MNKVANTSFMTGEFSSNPRGTSNVNIWFI
jgi:hypothetical protein